ncbi:MAG: caspase family protein [Rhodospirillales bacterium]
MKKKALLVGINKYSAETENLRGCINDVINLKDILIQKRGFQPDDIKLVLDEAATDINIKQCLNELVSDAVNGDQLVFGFSGHGVQKGFNQPGEEDGRNEAIVPHNISYQSLITDNELFDIITQRVKSPDIKFTAIYDCCHSGTLARTMSFDDLGNLVIITNRCLNMPDILVLPQRTRSAMIGPYNVLSACKDSETAADLKPQGSDYRGAFSYSLHNVWGNDIDMPINDLEGPVMQGIKEISPHKQTPQYYAVDPALPAL